MTQPIFKCGYNHELDLSVRYKAEWGNLRSKFPLFRDDTTPIPSAFSLSRFRKYPFDQGQAGTCWINTAVQMVQIHTAVDVELSGQPWEIVPLSRRFAAYYGKFADGTNGNPDDGGSIAAGLVAMSDDRTMGRGVCHEDLWPYPTGSEPAMRAALGQVPSAGAIHDASACRISRVADLANDLGESVHRSILNGHPCGVGIPWPDEWDTLQATVFNTIPTFSESKGHAVTLIGWYTSETGRKYWQIENSHGAIYTPLPAEQGKKIPGYTPTLFNQYGFIGTHDFWVGEAGLLTVLNRPISTTTVAAGLAGFLARPNIRSFVECFE